MKLLLDTHVVLWQLSGVQRLGVRASETIASATELAFSVVSFAEIGVKAAVGKLAVPDDLHAHVVGTGLRVLGLSPTMDWPSRAFRCITVIRSTGYSSPRRGMKDSRW